MKVIILVALALLLVSVNSIVAPTLTMGWNNWIQPTWKPTWLYNTSWIKPAVPAGLMRKALKIGTPEYLSVPEHYAYLNKTNPTSGYYCAPISYLNSKGLCERNPYYWDPFQVDGTCSPDPIINSKRHPCDGGTGDTLFETCCYKFFGTDLFMFTLYSDKYPSLLSWSFIPPSICLNIFTNPF